MKEIWKDVVGYEGKYEVSNLGNVRVLDYETEYIGANQIGEFIAKKSFKGKLLKPSVNHKGYLQVVLRNNGKKDTRLVHRLVAEAFIPNPNSKATVNHIDGNRQNDCVDNLEWATKKEQQEHARDTLGKTSIIGEECRRKGILLKQRRVIRSDGVIFDSIKQASMGDDILRRNISQVCKGKKKTAGGYYWAYVPVPAILPYIPKEKEKTGERMDRNFYRKPVIRSDNVFFNSVNEAAISTGTFAQCVTDSCKDPRKTAKGYGFRYATEEEIEAHNKLNN